MIDDDVKNAAGIMVRWNILSDESAVRAQERIVRYFHNDLIPMAPFDIGHYRYILMVRADLGASRGR